MKIVYVVKILKYGDRESRSYIDGVYPDIEKKFDIK